MEKRNRLWRRKQGFRVFKARLKYLVAGETFYAEYHPVMPLPPLHWFELSKMHWAKVYKTTSTPCSCRMCRGERYDRKAYKADTQRILRESMDD